MLTTAEAARLLEITPAGVRKLQSRGLLPEELTLSAVRFYEEKRRPAGNPLFRGSGITRSSDFLERARERQRARVITNAAIREGRLERPTECSESGGDHRGRVEVHHEDYADPLAVRGLCVRHHRLLHREQEGPGPWLIGAEVSKLLGRRALPLIAAGKFPGARRRYVRCWEVPLQDVRAYVEREA